MHVLIRARWKLIWEGLKEEPLNSKEKANKPRMIFLKCWISTHKGTQGEVRVKDHTRCGHMSTKGRLKQRPNLEVERNRFCLSL